MVSSGKHHGDESDQTLFCTGITLLIFKSQQSFTGPGWVICPPCGLWENSVIAAPQDCHNRVWKVVGDSLKGSRDIITKRRQKDPGQLKTTDVLCVTFQVCWGN